MTDPTAQSGDFILADKRDLIATTKQISHLPIPQHQWNNIRSKANQIGGESWILPGIATTFLGGVLAAGFALFASPMSPEQKHNVWWFLAWCAIAALGFGTAAKTQRSQNVATANDLTSIMDTVEATINMPS